MERYKARLITKSFAQRDDIDFTATFSSKDSIKTIMTFVAHFDLELYQMDVKCHAPLPKIR